MMLLSTQFDNPSIHQRQHHHHRNITISSSSMVWLLVLVMVSSMMTSEAALSQVPIAFRLDDIQCGWMESNSQTIIDAFIRHEVPLSIGVITGPGTCYSSWLRPRLTSTSNDYLELASHSVSHPAMANLTYAQQVIQLNTSRQSLISLFGSERDASNITLFIAPYNDWNFDTITALVATGYKTLSGQCSVDQTLGSGAQDNSCTVNMYPTVERPFFKGIDLITHVDVGASTSHFITGVLTNYTTFLYGSKELCQATGGVCSVTSQIEEMAQYTNTLIGGWSAIMMHPQDWSDGDDTSIDRYFDALLPIMKAKYQFFTISGIINAATKKGLGSVASSSTGSSNTNTTISSSLSLTPNAAVINILSVATMLMALLTVL